MFGDRFQRSWQIVKASAAVLRDEKKFLVFPLLSGLCMLMVGGVMVWDAVDSGFFEALKSDSSMISRDANTYVWLFVFYVVQYFVIIFFNTALAGAAIAKLHGGEPTIGDALKLSLARIGPIFGYAIIAATVGVLIRMIADRGGLVGRLIGGALGLAWTVLTFLVVPVMAAEGIGPVEAVKRSARLLRGTWGENLIGNGAISIVVGAVIATVIGIVQVASVMLATAGHPEFSIALYVVAALVIIPVAVIGAALTGIYSAALYSYAVAGDPPAGFESLMKTAFKPKG